MMRNVFIYDKNFETLKQLNNLYNFNDIISFTQKSDNEIIAHYKFDILEFKFFPTQYDLQSVIQNRNKIFNDGRFCLVYNGEDFLYDCANKALFVISTEHHHLTKYVNDIYLTKDNANDFIIKVAAILFGRFFLDLTPKENIEKYCKFLQTVWPNFKYIENATITECIIEVLKVVD